MTHQVKRNHFSPGRTTRALLALVPVATLLAATPLHAQWTQTWGDDFNGSADTTYNHNNWWNKVAVNNNNNPWGDGTDQSTSDSLQNVYLNGNGNLVIALTYDPNAPGTWQYKGYTSARLTGTSALGPYGKIDANIQNPPGQGVGAAFWALGADIYPAATAPNTANPSTNGGVPWPYSGELDMMEIQAQTASHNGSTVHGSNYGNDMYVSATVDLTAPATFDNSFHTFTTQWMPFHFFFYLDGSATPYGDIDIADTAFNDTWELNQAINPILSSGIGANGGTPGTTGFPSNMLVNYVHYSKWAAGAPGPVTSLTATANYSNAVNLSWSASSTSGVTYDIYASTTAGYTPSQFNMVAQNVSGTSYQHTGLQPNTTYYYTVVAANFGGESTASTATATTQVPGNSTGMQLSAGGWAVGEYQSPTSFVVGGNTNAHYHVPINTSQITTTPAPQQVYDTERWGAAAWTVTGLTPGAGYNVNLHFVETTHNAANARNFNVSLNSQTVLTNFDIFAAAGGFDKAINRPFYTKADSNGIIELQTQLGTSTVGDLNPTISAIEIIPASGSNPVGATPGTLTNLAINSGGPATGTFLADEDFNGGDVGAPVTTAISTTGVTNPAPLAVYQTTRIAPFTYILTGLEANATYNLRLHFAETYFTASNQRVFNVLVNGNTFLSNFDIVALAGPNHALIEQTPATADEFGQLIVQFLPGSQNTPEISGVEAILSQTAVVAPKSLTATAASGAINLAWTASTTGNVAYSLYRATAGAATSLVKSGITGTTYSDTAITNGTTYNYFVVATLGSGASPNSNWASATAGSSGVTQPNPPTDLTATAVSSSQINLSWTASTTPGVYYEIFASTTANVAPSEGTLVASTGGTTYSNTGLTAGTTYFYAVEAVGSTVSTAARTSATTQGGTGGGGTPVSIDSGSSAAVGAFVADTDFINGTPYNPGQTATVPAGLANAAPAAVYGTSREGSNFSYTVPGFVKNSTGHTVTLHFAELYFGSAQQREFNVSINGNQVLTNFDIFAAAGNKKLTAVVEQFGNITANPSGQIVISFTSGAVNQPSVNGIVVK